jgi:hypothetical protein
MTDTRIQNMQRYEAEVERIRKNPDLHAGAKQRMVSELHDQAAAEHARLTREVREAREQALRSAEGRVFAISYPERATASEKAMIALSYRDARDRAERAAASSVENPDALADLLDRAEKTGDAQLAEAVYHVATLRGARSVADTYLAERPKAQSRWESYVEARQEMEPLSEALVGLAAPQRPSDMAG